MVAVLSVGEVVVGKVGPGKLSLAGLACICPRLRAYPDSIISSSTPYSFMCCRPHPSLILLGMCFFRSPVRFGVWYILTSTRSGPNSATKGASKEAHDALGASRVPRRASVRMLSLTSGFFRRVSWSVAIFGTRQQGERSLDLTSRPHTSSASDFPMYSVARNILLSAFRILS